MAPGKPILPANDAGTVALFSAAVAEALYEAE
jgi:hypothetical protein